MASAGGVVVGLGTSVVVGRELGPEGKGSYDLAIATAGLLALTLGLSLPGGIAYAVARQTAGAAAVARLLAPATLAQALVAAAILWFGSLLAPAIVGYLAPEAMAAVTLLVAVSILAANLRALLIGRELIVRASVLDFVGRSLVAGAIVTVVVSGSILHRPTAYSTLLWATAAAGTALCIMTWVSLRPVLRDDHGPLGLRSILGFALPAHLGNLLQFLNYRLDLFLVSAFAGLAAVGVYALAVSFAQLVWLAPGAIAVALLPRVASESSDGRSETDVERLSRVSLVLSVGAAVVMALVGPLVIAILYGSSFSDAGVQLALLLPGVALFGPASVLASYIGGKGRQRLNLNVSLVALVVTIVFDLALIPPFGGAGAAIASSLSYGTTAVLTVAVAARVGSFRVKNLIAPRRADLADLVVILRGRWAR